MNKDTAKKPSIQHILHIEYNRMAGMLHSRNRLQHFLCSELNCIRLSIIKEKVKTHYHMNVHYNPYCKLPHEITTADSKIQINCITHYTSSCSAHAAHMDSYTCYIIVYWYHIIHV